MNDDDAYEQAIRDVSELVPIWPEDVLTEAEWEAGWLDRQIIAGRRTEADRATTPRWLGGEGQP
jgi:hypothetical protein